MKALTISQPYASLISIGEKFVENRIWSCSYRGPLAIHAGSGTQYISRQELLRGEWPTGQIIATCRLVACVHIEEIRRKGADPWKCRETVPGTHRTWHEVWQHRHAEGPWCWILEDVVELNPAVVIAGKQRLWNWEPTHEHIR